MKHPAFEDRYFTDGIYLYTAIIIAIRILTADFTVISRQQYRRASKKVIIMNGFIAFSLIGFTLGVPHSYAQTLPQATTIDGARPGHTPGQGQSLPLSNKASNIAPASTNSDIAPTLPSSSLGDNDTPTAYLLEARADLVATGRTGQAQQALEMAQSRMLNRVIPPNGSIAPSNAPRVGLITDAREALGRGDTANAIRLIDEALAN